MRIMDWSSPEKHDISKLSVADDLGAKECRNMCRNRDGCEYWNTKCVPEWYFCYCFTVTDAVYLCEQKKGGVWSVAGNRNSEGMAKVVESKSKCNIL